MKEEAQRIAIAEACGRIYHKPTEEELKSGSYYQYEPDYLHDLNAMHEAEKMLNERQMGDYHYWILDNDNTNATHFVPGACPTARQLWYLTHAAASQRAEAFLRTLGKWVEE